MVTGKLKVATASAAVASIALLLPSTAGEPETTLPTKSVLADVLFTKQQMIGQNQAETLGSRQPGYQAFVGSIPRGSYLKFLIFNRSNKVHDFSAFGKGTKPVKPDGKASFNKYANIRGRFPTATRTARAPPSTASSSSSNQVQRQPLGYARR
jgi:hypothetical protein